MKELLSFDAPKHRSSIIKVLGVGGGGSNAVTHMFKQGIKGVDFIVCNTDAQAMEISPVPNKIQLGKKGLGAGSIPEVGREAAEENIEDIKSFLDNGTKMLFITAGMGGGTGTGATPVIAKVAREMGILTVAIVTIPFLFEGRKRRLQAENGIDELRKNVDTLLMISNEKLREIYGNLRLSEAFGKADDILTIAAKGIAEIITVTGYINVDFEDVKTVMKNSGTAIMGSSLAEGENRARKAVEEALSSPLLNDNKINGASNILLYIASGKDEITFDEVTEITDYIQREAGQSAEIIWGNGYDESLENKISITLIATGFKLPDEINATTLKKEKPKTIYVLGDTPPAVAVKQPETTVVEPEHKKMISEEPDTLTEIKLIKKEKTAEPPKKTEKEIPVLNREILLFDSPGTPVADEALNEVAEPKIELNTKLQSSNPNLKIKYTVGDFVRPDNGNETPGHSSADNNIVKKADDRVKKLHEMSFKIDDIEENLDMIETVPAFVRKNVSLNPVTPSSESVVSRYSLSEEEGEKPGILNNENKFLHNKPD